MRKLMIVCLMLAMVVAGADAKTVTNRGEVITVETMESPSEGSTTVVQDILRMPQANLREGFVALHYTVPAAGVTGDVDLVDFELPTGTIFGDGCILEVQTALLPDTGTTAISCGGATLTSAGNLPEATGIDSLTCASGDAPSISTSDDVPYVSFTATVTQGEFTVYAPFILGNAQ